MRNLAWWYYNVPVICENFMYKYIEYLITTIDESLVLGSFYL